MRYTHWNEKLGRYTVPCIYKAEGDQITFYFYTEPGEPIASTRKLRTIQGPGMEHVYGEVIDRLALLENRAECADIDRTIAGAVSKAYDKAIARLTRQGLKDPLSQISALEQEIDYYRAKIKDLTEREEAKK